jgi:AcrR family transcriptional regulator
MRNAASAAGTTTTAIYSLFGGRQALIEAVVVEGFQRFAVHLRAVPHTTNPYADLLALGKAYRVNAIENPHFYRVMFNNHGSAVSARTPERGAETFDMLVAAVERATRCTPPEARVRAYRLWAYIHGLVSLEFNGFVDFQAHDIGTEEGFLEALRAASSLFEA